jgi:adenine-specific DNA-methyltransferase
LQDILCASGNLIRTIEIAHKPNVMGGMRWTNEWIPEVNGNENATHCEYLFLLEKS